MAAGCVTEHQEFSLRREKERFPSMDDVVWLFIKCGETKLADNLKIFHITVKVNMFKCQRLEEVFSHRIAEENLILILFL